MRRWILGTLTVLAFTCQAQPQRPLFIPAPGSPVAVGSQPNDLALGDVNADGHLDIVTANFGSHNVTILLGDGRGGFRPAPGSPFPAGPAPHLVALGDFNRDDRLDLASTSHDSNDVTLLLGDGRGRFTPVPGSPVAALRTTPPHNHGLLFADANRDRALDLITANQNDHSVSVLLGDAGGRFRPATGSPFRVGRRPYGPALGDVNRDGYLDIVTPNFGDHSVALLLGDGRGQFSPAPRSPYNVLPRPYFIALADLNRDARLDLAVAHDDNSNVLILLGDGQGGFAPAPGSPLDVGRTAGRIVVNDFNADGRKDMAISTAGQAVAVFLGDGRGRFQPAPGSPYPTGRAPWAFAVGDINSDGRPDIVTANSASHTVTVLLGQQP